MTQDEVEAIFSEPGADGEPLQPGSFRGYVVEGTDSKSGPTRVQDGVMTYWNAKREINVTYKAGKLIEKQHKPR